MQKTASNLYLLNATLLITHEVDSAYWKEWELFGIPGGIQLFVILNFLLVLTFLLGYKQVLLGTKSGSMFSLALAFGGIFAFVIHMYFIVAGHAEFTLPISLAILISTLIVSLVQGYVALKSLRA